MNELTTEENLSLEAGSDGVVDLREETIRWRNQLLPSNLPKSFERRLFYTANVVCRRKREHTFRQLCWDHQRPYFQKVTVTALNETTAGIYFDRVTDFNDEQVFGKVAAEMFRRSDVVYLLSDTEPSLKPGPRVAYVSDAFEKMTGYDRADIIGKTPRILQGEETEMACRAKIREALSTWDSTRVRITNYRKCGEKFKSEVDIQPIADEIGWWEFWFATQKDLTTDEMEEASRSRTQKLESIGQLSAGIAHEINTPMQFVSHNLRFLSKCASKLFTVVDQYRELLEGTKEISWRERREKISRVSAECNFDHILEQFPKAIEECREGIERTIKIVKAMKDFSHPGNKTKSMVNLNEAIESAVSITHNRWKYSTEMELELDPNLPEVEVYAAEINQVLLNLIVNAADAIAECFEEGPLGKITVRTRHTANFVQIDVQDNGCGIPEEIRQKIFDPFFTTKEVGKGTGQGLAITHNVIVNMHHGEIDLFSEEDRGTTFTLHLPLEFRPDQEDEFQDNTDVEPTVGIVTA